MTRVTGKGSKYVDISIQEMDELLLVDEKGKLPCYKQDLPGIEEVVYEMLLNQNSYPGLLIRIMSSIKKRGHEAGSSRDYGEDAIRILLINTNYDPERLMASAPHTKRMIGWQDKVREKIRYMTLSVYASPACKVCNKKTILRKNNTTKQEFWACQGYPHCRYTAPYDLEEHENQIALLSDRLDEIRRSKQTKVTVKPVKGK